MQEEKMNLELEIARRSHAVEHRNKLVWGHQTLQIHSLLISYSIISINIAPHSTLLYHSSQMSAERARLKQLETTRLANEFYERKRLQADAQRKAEIDVAREVVNI